MVSSQLEVSPAMVEVESAALSWPARAQALVIDSPENYTFAAEMVKGIKALRGKVDEAYDDILVDLTRALQTARDKKKAAAAPLDQAEQILKRGMVDFAAAQERRRLEEQRRLEAEAKAREEEAALARAVALEREGTGWGDQGLLLEAAQIVEEAIQAPPPALAPLPTATPKVAGISHKTQWKGEVTNLAALIRFVAANPQHSNLLAPNQTAIDALARAMQSRCNVPGIRTYGKPIVSASGR